MRSILAAAAVALIFAILCTPLAIKFFRRWGIVQEIQVELPQSHQVKRGTPQMGGLVIILATLLGYTVAHLFVANQAGRGPTASGLLALSLMVGMGLVGFLDDFTKVRNRRSLGLTKTGKLIGQAVIALIFGLAALRFKNDLGLAPASDDLSFVRDLGWLSLGTVGFIFLSFLLIAGFSNAVNLTDGLDGLCAGTSAMVFGAYVVVTFYQFRNSCGLAGATAGCYEVRDPLDLALVAAAALGACFGFLWWNANPARIFMGDVGAMPLGALMAGIAIMSRTELLLVVLAALSVIELVSVVLQVASYKTRRKRIFNMAPIHGHFELAGWKEMTVIVRFWIVSGLAVAFGLGIFYAEFISHGLPD